MTPILRGARVRSTISTCHRPMSRRRADLRNLALAFVLLTSMAVLGEAGHVVLDEMNAVVAHHVFHIMFPLIAFAAFGSFVARDIRAHGWPTFSWRLEPPRPLRRD